MRKVLPIIGIIAFCTTIPAHAQSRDSDNAIDSFNEFRKKALGDFQSFRKSVLDGYAEYLDTVWKEYQAFKGDSSSTVPKPVKLPTILDDPFDVTKPAPAPVVVTTPPAVKPKPKPKPVPKPTPKPTPVPTPTPPTVKPTVPVEAPVVTFNMFGKTLSGPKLNCVSVGDLTSHNIAEAWRKYADADTKKMAAKMKEETEKLQLNDWLAYQYVMSCVNAQTVNPTDRVVMQQFLLSNMGYDVRIAITDNKPLLLMAIQQTVYSRSYLILSDKRYYTLDDTGRSISGERGIRTCNLPDNVYLGETVDMRFYQRPQFTGDNGKQCKLASNGLEVNVTIDSDLMEMLRHYPQLDINHYQSAKFSPTLVEQVCEQLRPQLEGSTPKQVANKLLHFVQDAFDYATDDEQFGYEKPYFFEENFYYPKNDCEDRAIFYATLIKNLTQLDIHLVIYPGHACTAICFGEEKIDGGISYLNNNKTYYICDPTYIGANIGHCMSRYIGMKPEILTCE